MKQYWKVFLLLSAVFLLQTSILTPTAFATEPSSARSNETTQGETTVISENLFKVAALGLPSTVNLQTAMSASDTHYTASPVEVTAGDVLYLAPVNLTDTFWIMAAYDASGKGLSETIRPNDTEEVQKISDGTDSIVKYTVPSGVSYVIPVATKANAKTTVMTKNQPFTEQDWRAYLSAFDADASTPISENSTLNGKKALFIGDSINAGSYDILSPSTGKAFAGRIALSTGLQITNVSVGGATLLKRNDKSWIVDQLESQKEQDFDLIVVFGGVNDIRYGAGVGTFVTNESQTGKINHFTAGLQYLLLRAKEQHPNAEIVYISCFPLPNHKVGNASDMSTYAESAKTVCEAYQVHFIDLYNNAELTEQLQPQTVRYLPDLLHPTSEGYDLITPYIQSELEEIFQAENIVDQTTAVTESSSDAAPDTSAPIAQETTASATSEHDSNASEKQTGGCSASASATAVVLAAVGGGTAMLLQNKEKAAKKADKKR